MFKLIAILLSVFMLVGAGITQKKKTTTELEYINSILIPATVELVIQNSDGIFSPLCTAFPFYKDINGYLFVTAEHCVANEDDKLEEYSRFLYLRQNYGGNSAFIRTKVVKVGCRKCGVDLAILMVGYDLKIPLLKLGNDAKLFGEKIWNPTAPIGRGVQILEGIVSNPSVVDRPTAGESHEWTNATMVQLYGNNPGSSGSPIVCATQMAVCGIIVGTWKENYVIAIPISRLLIVLKALLAQTDSK